MTTIKGWRRSKHYAFPKTKAAWISVDKDTISIVHVPSSNIPYKIMLNSSQIDRKGTLERAKRMAAYLMRNKSALEERRRYLRRKRRR